MYICLCKSISEKDLKEAISDGYNTYEKLNKKLGVGTDCGSCIRTVKNLINIYKRGKGE